MIVTIIRWPDIWKTKVFFSSLKKTTTSKYSIKWNLKTFFKNICRKLWSSDNKNKTFDFYFVLILLCIYVTLSSHRTLHSLLSWARTKSRQKWKEDYVKRGCSNVYIDYWTLFQRQPGYGNTRNAKSITQSVIWIGHIFDIFVAFIELLKYRMIFNSGVWICYLCYGIQFFSLTDIWERIKSHPYEYWFVVALHKLLHCRIWQGRTRRRRYKIVSCCTLWYINYWLTLQSF